MSVKRSSVAVKVVSPHLADKLFARKCDVLIFKEEEICLPENYETVKVGDVVKNKVDKVLEEEGLTPKKMLIYFLCGAIGVSIGFLIVYFMSR